MDDNRMAIYTEIAGTRFTKAEMAILNATKSSENAQTLEALRRVARYEGSELYIGVDQASRAMSKLIGKGVLKPSESYDGHTVFSFGESDFAQAVYCEIYQVEPIEA